MTHIEAPGIYDIPEDVYHADPCIQPSLSSSIARLLIGRSPRHAWTAHPRLNPHFQTENKTAFDIGRAAHASLLGAGSKIVIIDAADYRTTKAKMLRDKAYADGKTPLLQTQTEVIGKMTHAAAQQLEATHDARDAFTKGKPEQTLVWQDDGMWCRARLDWLPDKRGHIYDYKTTSSSAGPDSFMRSLFDNGYDFQAAFYLRGVANLLDWHNIEFRFVVQETSPPYALSVVALTPAALDMARRKVAKAIELWRWCMNEGKWPGYPGFVAYVDPPVWHEKQWTEGEDRETLLRDSGKRLRDLMIDWQAPTKRETAE